MPMMRRSPLSRRFLQVCVSHGQKIERFGKAGQRLKALGPVRDFRPLTEIETTHLREGYVAQAENIGDGRNGGTEKGAAECRFQRRKRSLGGATAVCRDDGINVQGQKSLPVQLGGVAAEDGGK